MMGTHELDMAEGQVRSRKESDIARRTHDLNMVQEGTSQDSERKCPSETYSHSGEGRGRVKLGHGKQVPERGALTCWRRQRDKS